MKILRRYLNYYMAAMLMAACETDSYEKGTGQYSLLQADFVEAPVQADGLVTQVITDDDIRLTLTQPAKPSWEAKADTIYRALLYYNKVERQAEVVSLSRVATATILPVDSFKNGVKTDPVRFESAWLSKNHRYLNAGIFIKTGNTTDKAASHLLAIIADTLLQNPDGTSTLSLLLCHDRGGMPEHYSVRSYFSIPMKEVQADSVRLTLHTYDGVMTKRFSLR